MLKSYFLVAWRSIAKNKVSSFINIFGLSVGMAVAVIIGLWIWDEGSFDRGFDHYEKIAQVMQTETHNGQMNTGKGNVMPLAAELRAGDSIAVNGVCLSAAELDEHGFAADAMNETRPQYTLPG